MEVVVEDKQLSLAIGKKGQNVRLAAKLTGWRIDIKSEEEKRREIEAQLEGLSIGGAVERRAVERRSRSAEAAPETPCAERGPPTGPWRTSRLRPSRSTDEPAAEAAEAAPQDGTGPRNPTRGSAPPSGTVQREASRNASRVYSR